MTREGATRLAPYLADAVESRDGTACLTLDLAGTGALAPAFFDELLGVLSELSEARIRTVAIKNPPARSPTRTGASRVAGAQIRETGDSEWEIRCRRAAPPRRPYGPVICSGWTQASNCSAVSRPSSTPVSFSVAPRSCAVFAILAALS